MDEFTTDPCPACKPNTVCKTPSCGRLKGKRQEPVIENKQAEPVAQPYAYVYEFDSRMFGIHRSFSSNERNGSKPSRVVPVYTHPAPAVAPQHPDDEAVDKFAAAMKQKLAQAREKGRSGWQQMNPNELSGMLYEHVAKGDPRDVANFCMFLWNLGQPITPCQPVQPAACQYCNGTGDVHGIDGEWRGECTECKTAPAVAVNEPVGVIKRYGYQALFNAIAEATKIQGGCIGVSVLDFAKSLDAAIVAAEAEKAKGGV